MYKSVTPQLRIYLDILVHVPKDVNTQIFIAALIVVIKD